MGSKEAMRPIEALWRPLLAAARDAFAGMDGFPDLGERLRVAVDHLLADARAVPPERVGPLRAWRKLLARFEQLSRDEQEIEVARGLRLCRLLGGEPEPIVSPEPDRGPPPSPLHAPIRSLAGIGPALSARFAERGLETIEDLAWLVPRRYDDLRKVVPLAEALGQERATLCATVQRVRYVRWRRRFLVVELVDPPGPARLVARWFNVSGGMARRFVAGARVVLAGSIRVRDGVAEMANPEVLGDEGGGIRPRYTEIEGVAPAIVRRACVSAIERAAPHLVDGVPASVGRSLALPSLVDSLRALHDPPEALTDPQVEALLRGESEWHRRLAFDELFILALAIARRRMERRAHEAAPCVVGDEALARIERALPFALTRAQRRTIAEVRADLAQPRPMNRLLQGDVGAGKTAVAFAAAEIAVAAGRQVALMAPTEILAEQHLATLEPWARALGRRVALLTASTPRGVRESTLLLAAAGKLDLLIGTHALLAERVAFADLGLVIIDEQHRFGVAQRVRLRGKGDDAGGSPHLLVMTATPIPRTLALTFYGDLDASVLDEMPPGRTPPATRVLSGDRGRAQAYALLARVVAAGGRAFVVCPLVEPDATGIDEGAGKVWADATTTAASLARELAPLRVGLAHGRMPRPEREAAMTRLRAGELDVLVATTVIEVGVDVPDARVMLVEDADRFGLAQLHQLRGRVGRGGGASHCLLVTRGARTSDAVRRLAVLAETTDGFRIAEEDLKIRGPGEVLGVRQAGLPRLRFGDVVRHAALAAEARRHAEAILGDDPRLERPEHAAAAHVLQTRAACETAVGGESG